MVVTLKEPLPRSNLVESLAQEITAYIQRAQLAPGSRLPTVRELAGQLGVAVPTVREAIRRLEAFGDVEVRHGVGIFVRSGQPRVMLAHPGHGEIDGQVVLDLIEARLQIEPYLAEQAAETHERQRVAHLADLLKQAELELTGNDRILQQANMGFHVGVAECAGNVVLSQVMASLAELYAPHQALMLTLGDARLQDHREHLAIFAAIDAGDVAEAGRVMRDHLLAVKQMMTVRFVELAHARKVAWLDAYGEYGSRPAAVSAGLWPGIPSRR